MLKMTVTPTSATQKLMDLFDEFSEGVRSENKSRKTFALTKGPTRADYPSFDHVSHAVSISAKNVSNYLTPDAKKAFDQLG